MKIKLKLLFLICFVSKSILAQVLLPNYNTAFERQHPFNSDVIKKRGIKKITFEIVDKKDFETVIDKNLLETYEFDTNGFLMRNYYTTIVKSFERVLPIVIQKGKRKQSTTKTYTDYIYDTISTTYIYKNNLLVLKRYYDGLNYYESRYYNYDANNNLIKEARYKETNNSADKNIFILGNQILLSVDSMQFVNYNQRQTKCVYFNSEKRPYKENFIYKDSLGNVTKMFENYVAASWIVQEQKFTYQNNKLVSAEYVGNANANFKRKVEFEYDSQNELYTEKQYKNDVLIKEISYVTDKNNGLLNSFVERDPINKSMRIVKLKYDFGALSINKD